MEKFNLKWNDFLANVSNSFRTLRKENDFYDVSLISDDDQVVFAHKVVLSTSSDFFKSILRIADHSKPMIYLSGVDSKELNNILDYIYEGEVQLYQGDLDNFLNVAQKLKINGIIGEEMEDNKDEIDEVDKYIEPQEIFKESEEPSFSNDTKVETKSKLKKLNLKTIEKVEYNTKKYDRTVSVVTNGDTNIYEEAKRAVDDLIIKESDNCWVCSVCNKSSKTNSDMRRHAEVHIEGLSFPCQLCGDTFRSRTKLVNHKQTKHRK